MAHYAFDGDLKDSTGNFGAGSVTGDKLNNTTVGSITYDAQGKVGQAAVFNGASGIKLPNDLIKSNSYSVSLWVKPSQLTTFTTTFFGAVDTNHWVSLVPQGPINGSAEVWSGSATWYDAVTNVTLPLDQWTNLIFTVDKGAVNVYVNGEKKFTGSNFPDIFSNNDASFGMGVNYWDPAFKGEMDDLRVYSGVLTPTQLADLAKNN
jgi:arabinan endo-1,5-alpha-L-arabinosidase